MASQILILWRFTGIAAAILAWVVIVLSILQNPWFNVYRHALSDLGGPKASRPWIYNVGLMVVGVVACLYSFYLTYRAASKVHVYASALLFIAGVFLALIGVYPSGTRPHTFVSTWFFIQMWLAVIASAVGMALDGRTVDSAILSAIAIAGPLGAVSIKWPSVALLEIYGVILIDIYIALPTIHF